MFFFLNQNLIVCGTFSFSTMKYPMEAKIFFLFFFNWQNMQILKKVTVGDFIWGGGGGWLEVLKNGFR